MNYFSTFWHSVCWCYNRLTAIFHDLISKSHDYLYDTTPTMKYTSSDLHMAVKCNDLSTVEKIVRSGIDLNGFWWNGVTPVSDAVYRKLYKILEILVAGGADVNIRTRDDRSEPPLFSACRLNSIQMVKVLLKSPKLNIDQKDFYGRTPLWAAALHSTPEMVELLLDHNADINIAQSYIECPLYISAVHCLYNDRYKSICRLLIRRGCRLNLGKNGRNTLFWAVKNEDYETFSLLVHAGCHLKKEEWMSSNNLPILWANNSKIQQWIEHIQVNPRSLKEICAYVVRRVLSLRWKSLKLEHIEQLEIPHYLKKDLMLDR